MPCYDPRDNERIVYEKGPDPQMARDLERMRQKVNKLTDLLCKTGRARKNKQNIPPDVLKWWEEHCEIDRKRGEPW